METKTKRLTLLIRFIDVALMLIVASVIYTIIYVSPYAGKFADFANRLPEDENFNGIRSMFSAITYIAILKVVVMRGFFGIILWNIRKIVKSILNGELFQIEQINRIRKIAIYFLCFAGLLLFFNSIFMLAALNKGNVHGLRASITNLIGIFENYVLTALITFTIVEVFISGTKLKQEQDLTI